MMSVIQTPHVPILKDPISASVTKDIRETEEHVEVQSLVVVKFGKIPI